MTVWTAWAQLVLAGIGAPDDNVNRMSLWNWSNKESGANVMRWNNPLNTTMPEIGAVSENSVGVKSYPTVMIGAHATIATLLNGRYSTILDMLRRSVPHTSWQSACPDLETWGTGCDWFTMTLTPPNLTLEPLEDYLPMNQQMKSAFVRLAYLASRGREPNPGEADAAIGAVKDDGSNLDEIVYGIADAPEGVEFRAKLSRLQ